MEFLDFYDGDGETDIKYLVFDSKFTTYGNLRGLGKRIKFAAIRRRGERIVEELNSRPGSAWKKIRVPWPTAKDVR